jgi:hypothetical protein
VTGSAGIIDGRKDLAREIAIRNALRSAVEQAVGVMIQSESVVNDFQLIRDKISSQSQGFIRRYSITREKVEGEVCSVEVKALVSKVKLEKGLDSMGLMLKKMGKPRIVVLVSEQNALQDKPSYWWGGSDADLGVAENTLMTRLQKHGFNFVDRQSILANLKDTGLAGKLPGKLSDDAALRVIASGEVDIAIVGQAYAKAGAPVGGTSFRPCQATVSVRAVNADNGELLASASATAMVAQVNAAAGGAQALEKAAGECADKIRKQIVEKWSKRVGSGGMVKLVASGLDYRQLQDFMFQLKERLDEVEEVYERGFSGETAKMDLEVSCSAKQLASDLSGMEFGWGAAKISSLSANVLELKIIRK